jgi:4-oxalmesaconate hydratase
LIFDIHGHFTQAPQQLRAYRGTQVWGRAKPVKGSLNIPDDQIAQSLQRNLRHMAELDIACILFSPNAGWMGHDFGTEVISRYWTEVNNDLIAQAHRLYPDRFIPVCMLPQSPGVSPAGCLEELERCVTELGFVGCNINPDVAGGGQPFTPSLGDEWWYPLWEKMVELDVPGMIHASQTQNPGLHTLGAHYVNVDTASVVALCNSRVFDDFPTLKLLVPHGGGTIPYQWTRHRALHEMEGRRPFEEMVRHLYFDTTLYDRLAVEMLLKRLGPDNVLFGSEMLGAGKAVDPMTGTTFDHTTGFIKEIPWLGEAGQDKVFRTNAQKLFTRAKWPETPIDAAALTIA